MGYSSSPSGVVITILLGLNITMMSFFGRYFIKKIDNHGDLIHTLNISLASLNQTVEALDKVVDKMSPVRRRY